MEFNSLIIAILASFFLYSCQIEINKPPFNASNDSTPLFFPASTNGGGGSLTTNLQVGMSAKTIYPTSPVSLSGFGAPWRRLIPPDLINIGNSSTFCRPYQSIDHAPRVKAIIFKGETDNQDNYYLLINIDLAAIPVDFNIKILKELQRTFPTLNLSHANVQFLATHTHAGPAGLSSNPFWAAAVCDRFNPNIFNIIKEQLILSVKESLSNLGSIHSYDLAKYEAFGYNYTRFNGMPVDKSAFYLNLKDSTAKSLACIKTFSGHPTWYGLTEITLSADFVGYLEESMELKTNSNACAFFNSVVGNSSIEIPKDRKAFTDSFANETLSKSSNYNNTLTLKYGTTFITLPGFQINYKGCGISFGIIPEKFITNVFSIKSSDVTNNITKISWFSLGSTYFFLFPGEPLYDTKLLLEKMLADFFPNITSYVILSTANDYVGYLMTSNNYYVENIDTCSTIHGPNASATIIDRFKDSLLQFGN